MIDKDITDSVLLDVVKVYIDITGEGRAAFVSELQNLAEQAASQRFESILRGIGG